MNNKTKLVSEKNDASKISTNFNGLFQFFRKIFLCLNKFFSIILFRKFFDKSLSIEKFDNEEKTIRQKKNIGDNLSPWPPQAIHNFEDQKEVSDDFLDKIFSSYEKAIEDDVE